jgi:hypothetical protein
MIYFVRESYMEGVNLKYAGNYMKENPVKLI